MCALTVLGAFEVIVALASIGIGNWAVFAYPGHLRKTAAFNFWSGGAVSDYNDNEITIKKLRSRDFLLLLKRKFM